MSRSLRRCTLFLMTLLTCAGTLSGCAKAYYDYDAFVREPRPIVTASEYVLAPPDELLVTSTDVKEIDNRAVIIRPDGKINLPLLGTVSVAGRTPEQVQDLLIDIAAQFYEKKPDITVRVVAFNSKKVYVFGEVSTAGAYEYTGANTVIRILAEAQPTRLADLAKIRIVRPGDDGKARHLMTIDLQTMAYEGDSSLNVVLEEGDVIYVPPHPLAAIGIALQQILLPIQPAAATVATPIRFNAAFSSFPGP